jgi:glycosyltransferase involved in cell wall biosynthesis
VALPAATIYVYDNASTDRTAQEAEAAGAFVRHTNLLGKGNVLRRMFAAIEADVYVVADGDGTYDASSAPMMIEHLNRHDLDMVVGERIEADKTSNAFRPGHRLGNRFLNLSVRWLFGQGSRDMLSGFRVFSRRYVKSFPAFSRGFEIETEMTVHALDACISFEELPTLYRGRDGRSHSKLRTIRDGLKILALIVCFWKDYRPFRFFGAAAILAMTLAIASAISAHGELHTWTPATFLTAGFAALAGVACLAAVVLESLVRTRREVKRMLFLAADRTCRRTHEG